MYTREEVHERQRLEDLREFRKYLVETGAIKCLVKLYKHTAKHELRMDNPTLLKQFLSEFRQENDPATIEREMLERENATLREFNGQMEQQIAEMSAELAQRQRLQVGRNLWKALTLPEFWDSNGGADPNKLSIEQIYRRLCGCEVDATVCLVLVNLVRPAGLDEAAMHVVVPKADFIQFIGEGISEDLRLGIEAGMIPRMQAVEPAYEAEVIQAVKESGLYPDHLGDVAEVVQLDRTLHDLMQGLAQQFAGASPL